MLDKSNTSTNMPAIGTPSRFTEFSVWKPYVMNLLCRIIPQLPLVTSVLNLLCRIFSPRLQSVQQQLQEF